MFYRSILALFLIVSSFSGISAQGNERNILKGAISKAELKKVLLPQSDFSPIPKLGDKYWDTLDAAYKKILIDQGNKYLNYEWPSLLARRYMDYDIDGNRNRFSDRYYDRRNVLADLCMAEIVENNGRYLDDIINGIWLILEETTWVVPAHSSGNKLHDKDDVTVDLFSAETAALLAWVDYYFGDKFDEITPLIRKRIYEEVNRRVLQSMLDHNDFWYMGYTGRIPNNWNPWIVSNWLTAVLIFEKNDEKRLESVWKTLDVLDNYLNPYPADGGCDEGPSYWERAGASLFDCLFQLQYATKGEFNVFKEPLIINIGNYIHKINISKDWYVNFADGSAKSSHEPGTIYRIGKAINDSDMQSIACERYHLYPDPHDNINGRSPFGMRIIPNLMVLNEMNKYTSPYEPDLNYFFPDLEVAVSREDKQGTGFFMAIKGGFNNESHNHNDVGNFIIFCDGLPLFIDAGVGTYTRKTFSSERYTIWTMQSDYHNLPTINGMMQMNGDDFKAKNFRFENKDSAIIVKVELSGAYPQDAFTKIWNRSLELNRKSEKIILTDSWELAQQTEKNKWNFLLAYEPEIMDEGDIRLSNGESSFQLKHDKHLVPVLEKIELDDDNLVKVWGKSIWRITLTRSKKGLKGTESFTVQKYK